MRVATLGCLPVIRQSMADGRSDKPQTPRDHCFCELRKITQAHPGLNPQRSTLSQGDQTSQEMARDSVL